MGVLMGSAETAPRTIPWLFPQIQKALHALSHTAEMPPSEPEIRETRNTSATSFGRENDSAVQGEKLENKGYGSLSVRAGAFHHRFNRVLKKERRRLQTTQHLPTSPDLEHLGQAHDSKAVRDLEQSIQLREAVRNMDEWTRKVWAARQYGYSWKEIAIQLGLTEPQVKLRFRYAIGKLRARLSGPT
jgi:DNA-directed RNA polymerase specialized sigma subunit